MPVLLIASAVLTAGAALVGFLVAGGRGAAGATAGVVLVSFSYTLSTLVIAKADQIDPKLVLPWGMATYVTKFSLFGVAMIAIIQAGWTGLAPFGWGVAAGVVGWTGTHIWWINAIYRPPTSPPVPIGGPVGDRSSPSGREEE